ncbi:MAG TPA: F0F1 ATP synthase subunit A [Nitrospiria bacterium]|jgi:F-type H+-transporting ATPase subunit a|nr:F0F1 ATP synthase subunit A [Nitrospiria bacterium]
MATSGIFGASVFHLGPLVITQTVVTTWGILLGLSLVSWFSTRRLSLDPGPWQTVVEGAVSAIEDAVSAVLPDHSRPVLPFIGTLWIFIVTANLVGLIPGLQAPTGDLSLTAALAVLVFLSAHWYGIRTQGLKNYLRHYLTPNPILLPFHLLSEISRTIALAVRLFGNMMSLQLAALLVLLVAGFLVPVPLLLLHIVEALVQAYIFGMLALIYVAGGIQYQQLKRRGE